MGQTVSWKLMLFFGFGLVWPSCSAMPALVGRSFATVSFLAMGGVLAAVVVVVLRDRLFPLSSRPRLVMGVFSVSAVVSLLLGVAAGADFLAGWAFICMLYFLMGACFAFASCAWLELIARLDLRHAALCICGSHALTALCGYMVFALHLSGMSCAVVIATMMTVSLVTYRACLALRYGGGEQVNAEWRFPFKSVVIIALFALTSSLVRGGFDSGMTNYARLGVVAVSVALFLAFFFRYGKIKDGAVVNLALECILVAVLFRMFDGLGAVLVSMFFGNLAFALFFIFAHLMMCRLSYRFGINPLLLFGSSYAAIKLSGWVSFVVERWTISVSNEFFMAACAVALFALVALFLKTVNVEMSFEAWGVSSAKADSASCLRFSEDVSRDKCAYVARLYSLTRREEETLVLLMRSYTFAEVEKELVIAHATVKSHVQHIYEKLGVHSKKELMAFVEGC